VAVGCVDSEVCWMIERAWSKLDFLLHVIVLCPPTNHRSDLRSDLGLMTENFCSEEHSICVHMLMSKYLGHVFVFRLLCFFILPFKRNPHPASQISNHPCLSDILAPHLPHPSILPNAWVRADWLKITSSGRLMSSTEHINTQSLFSRSEPVLLCSHQTRDFLSFVSFLPFTYTFLWNFACSFLDYFLIFFHHRCFFVCDSF